MPEGGDWLARPKVTPEARVRLVCLPFAGGGANVYRSWRGFLPAEVELCLAQLPGREVRFKEPPLRRVEPLVEGLASALGTLPPLPLVLFGHSLGALLAFELTRRLEAEGPRFPVRHLVASGRGAPGWRERAPLHGLPEAEFLEAIRRLGGTPEEVLASEELMRLLVPVLRADLAVDETHAVPPLAQVRCPVLALGARDDALVPARALEAWRAHAGGGFRAVTLEGGHFFVLQQRARVLAELGPVLAAAGEAR